ncbi:MAG: organomercurial lyase MerB [Gammaproteobacteria bacterium]|nr:MAG: organomercurial lyase MerB [Gammaproteobacteria bacterium]
MMNNPTSSQALSLHNISDYFVQAFPAITRDEQTLALILYRLLSLGKHVNVLQIQTETDLTTSIIEQALHDWPDILFDDDQQVIGFWGITVQPMTHRMVVDDHVCYAWCAWDTLFIPELLNKVVKVESRCPVTNNNIELIVSPTHAESANGKPLYLSFLQPDMDKLNDDITSNFCHFVYFFDSKQIAEQWLAEHPSTFLLTLDEAFKIAKQVNNKRFNLTLDQ